ncbi:hypothetical protein D3C74_342320 [compost metagenome]
MGGHAMVDQVNDSVRVTYHHPTKPPLLFQEVRQEQPICVSGPTRHRVEGCHDRGGTGFDRGTEGFQVDVAKALDGHINGVVVAAPFGLAIGHKMLDTRQNGALVGKGFTLVPADLRGAEDAVDMDVLAEAFHHSAPPGIA